MPLDPDAYKHAAYPLGISEHLSDEAIAHALDESARRSKAAHKASETRRQKRAEQIIARAKQATQFVPVSEFIDEVFPGFKTWQKKGDVK